MKSNNWTVHSTHGDVEILSVFPLAKKSIKEADERKEGETHYSPFQYGCQIHIHSEWDYPTLTW